MRPDAAGSTAVEPVLGFEVRRQAWPLDRVYGPMALGAALDHGRGLGPAGDRVIWLDTETTGLAGGTGTYVFLVGLAAVETGRLVITQYFLRDLAAEGAMLDALARPLAECNAVVTFNGTRFDLPLLETRFLLCRLRGALRVPAHLDLMTIARRLWHRRLGGYSLGLVERSVLGVERTVDVPGWLIPSLYVDYLRTGDPAPLEPVFAHNLQDLLSLLALQGVAGDLLARPLATRVPVDWWPCGNPRRPPGCSPGAWRGSGRPSRRSGRRVMSAWRWR